MFLPARELVVADLAADIARQRNRRAVLLEMHEHRLQKLARSDWARIYFPSMMCQWPAQIAEQWQ